MRRKNILIGAAIVAFVLAAAGTLVLTRIDPNDYASLIEAKVQEATGRSLKIAGKVGYSLSLRPTVAVDDVRFQNAPWGSRPDMLLAKRIELQIALLPLIKGSVEIVGLALIEPDLLLEIDSGGKKKNWEFQAPSATAQQPDDSGAEAMPITIRRARIENGNITYRHAQNKSDTRVKLDRLALSSAGDRIEISGHASFNEVPIAIAGHVESSERLGSKGAAGQADFTLTGSGLNLAAKGTIPLGPQALDKTAIKLDVAIADWNAAAKLTAKGLPRLPAMKASGTARIKASILAIDQINATLGKSVLHGRLHLPLNDKRSGIELQIESPFIDLAELLGPTAAKKPSADGRIFSAEPFALDALRRAHAKVNMQVAKLNLRDGHVLDNVHASISAANGRIAADPARVGIGGRELRMRVNADASPAKTLALNAAIDGQGIPLGALGAMLDITGTPEGSPTDIAVRFAGNGNSVRALMASANADVRIVIGAGRIKNRAIDFGADITELLNVLNPTRASDPYTELKCAVIRLPIRNGVAQVDNSIGAETAKVNVIAAGVIDLRTETLDLGFRTKAATGLGVGLGSLANLARLRGSLTQPSVELDVGNTASTVAQLGLAAATGGLSLLAGGLLSERVPDQPCHAALTGVARAQASAPREQSPVGGLLDGIKSLFSR